MALENITQQLESHNSSLPPVELWDPPYCGEMDIEIKSGGDWFYNGTSFKRMSLVKLFASVIKKEADNYFLVTPVEKVKINVVDTPFIVTQWQWVDESKSVIQLMTNLGDSFLLDKEHPITLRSDDMLSVIVRRNLPATIHRNVFYQWIEEASEVEVNSRPALAINSAGMQILLGYLDG